MINGTPAAIAALNGARSPAVGAPPPTVAEPLSVLTVAPPSPGKCFAVGATPPAIQPETAALVAAAARLGSDENAREASAVSELVGTSATGASVTLIPARLSACAAALASAPGCCADCGFAGGAQTTLRITPPSWSVQTIGVAPAAL